MLTLDSNGWCHWMPSIGSKSDGAVELSTPVNYRKSGIIPIPTECTAPSSPPLRLLTDSFHSDIALEIHPSRIEQ